MILDTYSLRAVRKSSGRFLGALSILLLIQAQSQAQPSTLRIGTSFSLGQGANAKETSALALAKHFFKSETGLDNEIVPQRNWRELGQQMASKELPLGIFEGYEFACAQAENPELKPLVLVLKGSRYPVACVVVSKKEAASDFTGLAGRALALPATSRGFPTFFVQRLSQAQGKATEEFFSKVTTPETGEDALNDVVNGTAQVAVVERTALEAYRERKPNRCSNLKELVCSEPVLPVVIAYVPEAVDSATVTRFRNGLVRAGQQERGQMLLALFCLTGFEQVPADFEERLAATQKAYPPDQPAK